MNVHKVSNNINTRMNIKRRNNCYVKVEKIMCVS